MPLASHASHLKLDDHHNLDLLRYVYARQTCCSPGSSSTDRTMRQAVLWLACLAHSRSHPQISDRPL